ncbi:MAG: glycerophosphodiester phosphodiesterase [Lachnospira sp.]|nr:glycerophosphodiester phosphodiesterase [Lachnospira sp.]
MFKTAKEDFWLLKSSGKHILIFELTYKLAATAVIFPLAVLLLDLVLNFAGISYLTNEYILQAVTNPVVIAVIIIFIIVFVTYCTYEMSFLAACFELKRQECRASIIETGLTALKRMKNFLKIKNIPLAMFYFILILAINITVWGNVIYSQTTVNLFKTYIVYGSTGIKVILAAAVIVIYGLAFSGVYSFTIFTLEGIPFRSAYKKSAKMVKKHFAGTVLSLIVYNLAILAIIGIFYVLISVILIVGVKLLDMAYIGSAVYLSVLKYVQTGTKILLVYVAIPLSYAVISRMYYKYGDDETIDFSVIYIHDRYFKVNRVIYFSVLIISLVLNGIYLVTSFHKNPFDRIAIFHETKITAHRGASLEAPENTLAAFRKAMEDLADYIELDVQLTSDGEVVVMHDTSALRTTGVDRNVSSMTLEEIKQLDAGSYYSEEYAGETVPTLEEVMELVQGRVMLNIEIKSAANSRNLAEKVIDIVRKYNVTDKCVVTSFDYNALKYVKQYEPKIQTGYILSVAYGDYYNMEDVDFFSMNASFLSKRTVDAIHHSGKQVYAWTVNTENSIKNLTNKGVDNIITDNPVLARETVYSRDTSETLINMIKYVFNR